MQHVVVRVLWLVGACPAPLNRLVIPAILLMNCRLLDRIIWQKPTSLALALPRREPGRLSV